MGHWLTPTMPVPVLAEQPHARAFLLICCQGSLQASLQPGAHLSPAQLCVTSESCCGRAVAVVLCPAVVPGLTKPTCTISIQDLACALGTGVYHGSVSSWHLAFTCDPL